MAHLFRIVLAFLALALPVRLAADPADISAASRSVMRIVQVGEIEGEVQLIGHGSGVVVAPGVIVTNAHVVAESEEAENVQLLVVPPEGRRGFVGTVIKVSPRQDLALLRVKGGMLPVATLSPQTVPDGADVFAVGYPGNVDMAQGLNMIDLIMPQPPVKTQGTSSAGRSSKSFDTVLHTAPIATGNSGGPLFDGCGRVVGINSFGTYNGDQSDSGFFFAVSMRELLGFLRQNAVKPLVASLPCQSMADFNRAEAERLAGDKASADAAARNQAERRTAALAKAERQAQLEIISARENGMALAGFALILALAAGAGAAWLQGQMRKQHAAYAGGAAGILLLGALFAWFTRPDLEDIDARAAELALEASPGEPNGVIAEQASGALRCVIDPARSRVTVSEITDVPFNWQADGCVNQRTQYGLAADGWSRILVPNEDQTVTVARFDPASATYVTERFLLDYETMTRAREERARFTPPVCGADEAAARQLGEAQNAVKALLPAQPNERMVYKCSPDPTATSHPAP
jgi:V8-like Glu-specific endopeptidase